MALWLNITQADGEAAERNFELATSRLTIGRADTNDLVLGDSKKSVSSNHLELRAEGDGFVVEDLGSTNGTRLDGERIAAKTPVPLEDGSVLILGSWRLRISLRPVGTTTPSTASVPGPPPPSAPPGPPPPSAPPGPPPPSAPPGPPPAAGLPTPTLDPAPAPAPALPTPQPDPPSSVGLDSAIPDPPQADEDEDDDRPGMDSMLGAMRSSTRSVRGWARSLPPTDPVVVDAFLASVQAKRAKTKGEDGLRAAIRAALPEPPCDVLELLTLARDQAREQSGAGSSAPQGATMRFDKVLPIPGAPGSGGGGDLAEALDAELRHQRALREAAFRCVSSLASELASCDQLQSPEEIGRMHLLTAQTLELTLEWIQTALSGRKVFEEKFGAKVTNFFGLDANPIKHAVTSVQLGTYLLNPEREDRDHRKIRDNLDKAFQDLTAHQLGLVAGVQKALKAAFETLDPKNYMEGAEEVTSGFPFLRDQRRMANAWQIFARTYEDMLDNESRLFNEMIYPNVRKGYLEAHEKGMEGKGGGT